MENRKKRFAILRNETEGDHILWMEACDDFSDKVEYTVIDFMASDWFEKIQSGSFDALLVKPSGVSSKYKQLCDERILILDSVLDIPIYPSPKEIYIYENKRFLYSWLNANGISHPYCHVFYSKKETETFLARAHYPIVAKTNIGASGSGVQILKSKEDALFYIEKAFSTKGANRRWGPNWGKGGLLKRGFHYILHPGAISKKAAIYKERKADKQSGFVLFQDYVEHSFEWRIVAIGDSYFAHKKLKMGEKASGSLLKNYDNPPLELLSYARSIMNKFGLYSQAIDVFENEKGEYLINEMQCIFGQSDPYQMLVDGKPGRYIYRDNEWHFDEGDFNQNQSYNLRIRHILDILDKSTK